MPNIFSRFVVWHRFLSEILKWEIAIIITVTNILFYMYAVSIYIERNVYICDLPQFAKICRNSTMLITPFQQLLLSLFRRILYGLLWQWLFLYSLLISISLISAIFVCVSVSLSGFRHVRLWLFVESVGCPFYGIIIIVPNNLHTQTVQNDNNEYYYYIIIPRKRFPYSYICRSDHLNNILLFVYMYICDYVDYYINIILCPFYQFYRYSSHRFQCIFRHM